MAPLLARSTGSAEGPRVWAEGDGVPVSTSQGQATLPDTASWAYWFSWVFHILLPITGSPGEVALLLPWEVSGRQRGELGLLLKKSHAHPDDGTQVLVVPEVNGGAAPAPHRSTVRGTGLAEKQPCSLPNFAWFYWQ